MQSINEHRHKVLTCIILLIAALLYNCARDVNAIYSHPYLYLLAIIGFIVSFALLCVKFTSVNVLLLKIMATLVVLVFLFTTLVSYIDTSTYGPAIFYFFRAFGNFAGIGAVIITLAIMYRIFARYLAELQGIARILTSILFFLPCLLSMAIDRLLREYKSTTNAVIMLLFLEIAALSIYYVINTYTGKDTPRQKKVVTDVMFLDRKETVKISGMMLRQHAEESEKGENRRYSLSMYINMNTNASVHYSAPIVIYGNNQDYKPLIAYAFDDASQQNAITFLFSKNIPAIKIDLPPQKWHHLVIVYDGTFATLYCNGSIARRVDLRDNMPVYDNADYIKIGSDSILNGAIKKVNFYTYELSAMDVLSMYHLGL